MTSRFQNRQLLTVFAVLLLVGFVPAVRAALVTSADQLSNVTVIDFSEFSGDFLFTAGPVQIGNPVGRNIEWFSTYERSVIGNGGYGLNANGNWTSARQGYTGLNTESGAMTYRFNDAPVSGVGGFVNYATEEGQAIIEVLDQNGVVLESYDVTDSAPISTPGANDAGAFLGIWRPQADIYALRLSNAYDVLDDLTFTSAPAVPVPTLSTWAMLLLAGLLGMLAVLRRRA